MSARGAVPAAGPAVRRVVAGAAPRSRGHRLYDPHTARNLGRKLTPPERDLLRDLHVRLTRSLDRLQAVAARHGESI